MMLIGIIGTAFINSSLCKKLTMTNETAVEININIKIDKEELFRAVKNLKKGFMKS